MPLLDREPAGWCGCDDLERGEGRRLWRACLERTAARRLAADWALDALDRHHTGRPVVIRPRLGQASFRLAVLEAYGQQCADTTERSLPVLEAAHIRSEQPAARTRSPRPATARRPCIDCSTSAM